MTEQAGDGFADHVISHAISDKLVCANCYWWACFDKRDFLGTCGHRDHSGLTTDKTETCDDYEPLPEDEEPEWLK